MLSFGVLIVENIAGRLRQHNYLYVSSIIENKALMSAMLLDDLKSRIDGWSRAKTVWLWTDCGPHFRAYNLMAHLAGSWFGSLH